MMIVFQFEGIVLKLICLPHCSRKINLSVCCRQFLASQIFGRHATSLPTDFLAQLGYFIGHKYQTILKKTCRVQNTLAYTVAVLARVL